MTNITLEQCCTIISTLWSNGVHDAKTLHKLTSIPRFTVYDYVKKLKNDNTLNPLPRSSRLKKLSSKKRHFLGRLISANRYYTCTELANILNENYTNLNVTD
ncbi:14443_t:CDS:1 [Funneliformis mosseae]|uniref:14443_t:CDS:1 n=1 Tax=Funneliformis mosseae TaxID=27381 RepID=A0A9N9CK44_FUNMO|nr:14443_t:CDS:1 [Funneliformis mosseae]